MAKLCRLGVLLAGVSSVMSSIISRSREIPPAGQATVTKTGQDISQLKTVSEAFWNGVDTTPERLISLDHRLGQRFLQKFGDEPAQVNLQVLGLQHSGTDLINALLHMNFGNQINYYSASADKNSPNSRQGYFVHANVKEKWRVGEQSTLIGADILALSVIRNPLAWLSLMRREPPIELADCVSGDDWLDKPCLVHTPGGPNSTAPSTSFSSLEAIWNQWNDGFEKATEFGFANQMVVPYESMVRNPEGTLEHIANFLNISKPTAGWQIPEAESDADSGREDVLRYMYRKEYLEVFSDKEKWTACGHLDKALQRMYGYDDCTKKNED